MNPGRLIISAITPVSAISYFYLFLFTTSITCQNLLFLTPIRQAFYQVNIKDSSISVVIVSATLLSYFYQHTVSAINQSYHLFTFGNSTMQLYQITYHLLVSATLITYVYLLPKYNTCLIQLVVPKIGNDNTPPKTTKNDHKPPANDYKPSANNHKLSASNGKPPNRPSSNSSDFIFFGNWKRGSDLSHQHLYFGFSYKLWIFCH